VIRFSCPHCGRPSEVPEALARLPLVCKQCGQRVVPAEAPKSPEPVAKPQAAVAPTPQVPAVAPAPKPQVSPAVPSAKPLADSQKTDEDILVTKADSTPDIDFNVGGPTAASLSEAHRQRPAGLSNTNVLLPAGLEATEPEINLDLLPKPAPKSAPKPAPPPEPAAPPEALAEATLVPFAADLVTFVLLVVVGMLLGEQLVGKPTGTVLSESGSAAKFPPIDLLLWGAAPVLFGLVYILLGGRERTVGAWLRRRAANAAAADPK
jgi:hypothetical protein